jgi:hypothetical protein
MVGTLSVDSEDRQTQGPVLQRCWRNCFLFATRTSAHRGCSVLECVCWNKALAKLLLHGAQPFQEGAIPAEEKKDDLEGLTVAEHVASPLVGVSCIHRHKHSPSCAHTLDLAFCAAPDRL